MKLNIYKKIFEIMEKYENMLISKNNKNILYKNNDNLSNDFNNDDFFKFIFKNIKIEKSEHCETINPVKTDENNIISKDNLNPTKTFPNIQINNEHYYENFLEKRLTGLTEDCKNKTNNNDSKLILYNQKINSINIHKNNNEVIDFIKKIYKKIILKCHPDKNGDKEIFIKCQKYYEDKFLIGLLYLFYKLEISTKHFNEITFPYELTNKIIKAIFIEIRIIQEKINNFCST
jgi:hypothetical protein